MNRRFTKGRNITPQTAHLPQNPQRSGQSHKRFYNGLSADDQTLIRSAAYTSARVNQGIKALNEALSLNNLQKTMEIYSPTAAELAQFRALAQPAVIEWLASQVDSALIDGVLQAVRDAEASFAK